MALQPTDSTLVEMAEEGRYQAAQVNLTQNSWLTLQLPYQDVRAHLSLEGRIKHDMQDLSMIHQMANGGLAPWLTIGDMQRPPDEALMWQQAISQGTAFDVMRSVHATQPTTKRRRIDIAYANKACVQLLINAKLGEK